MTYPISTSGAGGLTPSSGPGLTQIRHYERVKKITGIWTEVKSMIEFLLFMICIALLLGMMQPPNPPKK